MERSSQWVLSRIEQTLQAEGGAILGLTRHLGASWVRAVDLILGCQGKVVVFGLGKSGHVGRKIAASMASLGTPAFFLHAAEAAHGDLGMLDARDVVIAVSNSGRTDEVIARLQAIQEIGCPIIAMTRDAASPLGAAATVVLELPVSAEADHLNMAPTVSSTLLLAAGDALAVTVAELKQFGKADFGFRHPGGALGQRANR